MPAHEILVLTINQKSLKAIKDRSKREMGFTLLTVTDLRKFRRKLKTWRPVFVLVQQV